MGWVIMDDGQMFCVWYFGYGIDQQGFVVWVYDNDDCVVLWLCYDCFECMVDYGFVVDWLILFGFFMWCFGVFIVFCGDDNESVVFGLFCYVIYVLKFELLFCIC